MALGRLFFPLNYVTRPNAAPLSHSPTRTPDSKKKDYLEVHFFDLLPLSGDDIKLYEASFQSRIDKEWNQRKQKQYGQPVLLDKSPGYLRLPYVPCRIRKLWPGAKIIILVRFAGL